MQIPAAYASALAAVRPVFPGAMIAGGAMRDLDNERPVKDLDVFVPNTWSFSDFKHRALLGLPGSHRIVLEMGSCDAWGTPECVGVLNMDGPAGEYQLIGLSTGQETILDRIDFGICQIGYDGDEVIRTAAYDLDRENETFTLVRSEDDAQRDRSLKRFERLSAKYPGWTLIAPELGLWFI